MVAHRKHDTCLLARCKRLGSTSPQPDRATWLGGRVRKKPTRRTSTHDPTSRSHGSRHGCPVFWNLPTAPGSHLLLAGSQLPPTAQLAPSADAGSQAHDAACLRLARPLRNRNSADAASATSAASQASCAHDLPNRPLAAAPATPAPPATPRRGSNNGAQQAAHATPRPAMTFHRPDLTIVGIPSRC
jgi:hypothetical protein